MPIPPRSFKGKGSIRADIGVVSGSIIAALTLDGHLIKPRQAARYVPELSCLAAVTRRDGTIPAASAKILFRKLRDAETGGGFELSIESEADTLAENEIVSPADAKLMFPYDEDKRGILVFLKLQGDVLRYDGDGTFLGDGYFVTLTGLDILDPFLTDRCVLPPANFKAFFRALLPSIERKRRVDCPLARDVKRQLEIVAENAPPLPPPVKIPPPETESPPDQVTDAVRYALEENGAFIPPPESGKSSAWSVQTVKRSAPEPPVTRDFTGGALLRATMERNREGLQTSVGAAFREDIAKYAGRDALSAEYVPFTAYYPTFRAMSRGQIEYYLFLRHSLRGGTKLRADMSYVLLAAYEALAAEDRDGETLDLLFFIWEQYRNQYARLDRLFPMWIRDYIVLRGLSFPISGIRARIPFENTEQTVGHPDIFMSGGGVADSLSDMTAPELCECAGYKLADSRACAGAEGLARFSDYLTRAVKALSDFYEPSGGADAAFPTEPRTFTVRSYVGAVRTPEDSYDITYTYMPRSRNPALTAVLNSICRVVENAVRRDVGIRGRLRENELDPALRAAVENSFAPEKQVAAPPEPFRLELDLSRAAAIERESWSTTDKLIAIAGTEEPEVPPEPVHEEKSYTESIQKSKNNESDEWDAFLARLDPVETAYLAAKLTGDPLPELGLRLEDDVAESVNRAASEEIGDVVLEDGEPVDDYREDILTHIQRKG